MEPTRWLTDAEQRSWRAYLSGTALLNDALECDLQLHGVSLSEYDILAMLSETGGCCLRMSALADRVVQSRSRLTHTAARLERRGWVERRAVHEDRRGVELCLTDGGRAAMEALAPVHVASVRRHLIDHLTPAQFAAMGQAMEAVRCGILGSEQTGSVRSGLGLPGD